MKAVDKGLLKVMSKMGISTLRSYRSGQLFEAVGLNSDIIKEYFTGTASRINGIGLKEIEHEALMRRKAADEHNYNMLSSGGQYHYRKDGENHLWTPESMTLFRQAVQGNNKEKYKAYAKLINEQSKHLCTLRGLFEFL